MAAPDAEAALRDAGMAALLLAVDPHGLGGAWLRGAPGPALDRWLAQFRAALPAGTPWRRMPPGIADQRLLGGLDLAATLAAGRPVADRGLLAEADGGVVLAVMAERLPVATALRLAAVLDQGAVTAERDGMRLSAPCHLAVLALDEGEATDEQAPAALLDRLAFHLAPERLPLPPDPVPDVAGARRRLAAVATAGSVAEVLCRTALALGILSLRAPLLALRAARAAAALAGRAEVAEEDVTLAARLVLGPRATMVPAEAEQPEPPPPAPPEPPETSPESQEQADQLPENLADIVLAATLAALPPKLLAGLLAGRQRGQASTQGKAGAQQASTRRGRPIGARPGQPQRGARLNLLETLRAAAPWQKLRPRTGAAKIAIRRDDFRITRFRERTASVTIFVVDASGSQAVARLAEAKGAVELLLADCYVRRDQVALIAFRGTAAELLLPPTGALARARRALAGLPGGGGTPLASGIEAASTLAESLRRRGQAPAVILLTDGRANIARDGSPGRAQAEADAMEAARRFRAQGFPGLLVDTSPRPQATARALATAMGARCLPLPLADSAALAASARAALA